MKNQMAYMFLKALQYRSAKKALAKKLNKTTEKTVYTTPVKTVGIIINADETDNIEQIVKGLELNANIQLLCYHKNFKKTRKVDYPVFYEKDLGWKGKPKTTELQQFFDTPFDLLISYYSQDHLPLQLVSGLHDANLKVGIAGTDQEIHDIIIQTEQKEIATFTKELHKYLHILNKL